MAAAARAAAPTAAATICPDGHAAATATTTVASITFQCASGTIYGTSNAWCTHAADDGATHAASSHDGHVRPATSR